MGTFWECLFMIPSRRLEVYWLGLKGQSQNSFPLTLFVTLGHVKAKICLYFGANGHFGWEI